MLSEVLGRIWNKDVVVYCQIICSKFGFNKILKWDE
jgi:hypothetical protein